MSKINKTISQKDLAFLQRQGLVFSNEVVYIEGEIIIAENLNTKQKRIVDCGNIGLMLESTKKLLLG